jgi:hypothetical protein
MAPIFKPIFTVLRRESSTFSATGAGSLRMTNPLPKSLSTNPYGNFQGVSTEKLCDFRRNGKQLDG